MKKTTRLFVVLLALAVVLTASGPVLAKAGSSGSQGVGYGYGRFVDVEDGHWAQHDISLMQAKDVFGGYGNGHFGPKDPVTRIQLVCLALRVMGAEAEARSMGTDAARTRLQSAFGDAAATPTWAGAQESLAYAYEKGWLYGLTYQNRTTFRANDPATRLEVVVTLLEAMGLRAEAQARVGATIDAPDASTVPEWARGYVALAMELGLLRGDERGQLNVGGQVTRAQMAALLARVDDQVESEADDAVVKGRLTAITLGDSPSITISTTSGELNRYRLREREQAAEGDLGEDGTVPDADEQATQTQEGDDVAVTATYPVAAGALVFVDDKEATLEDLAAGMRVEIALEAEQAVLIDAKTAGTGNGSGSGGSAGDEIRGEIKGALLEIGDTTIKLMVTEIVCDDGNLGDIAVGDEVTLNLADEVEVLRANAELTLADLAAGQTVAVKIEDNLVVRVRIEIDASGIAADDGATGTPGSGH